MLVEDDPAQQRTATRILHHAGYSCVSFTEATEALQHLRISLSAPESRPAQHKQVDIIILDAVLPCTSGEKLLGKIKAIAAGIPVIVATGSRDTTRVSDFLKIGAQAIIAKPYEKDTLLDKLNTSLRARK